MPLEPTDQRYLDAARGYCALGMHLEANEELEKIDPFLKCLPEVLAARLDIFQSTKHWELAQVVAKQLVRNEPENAQWSISLAYATRRLESIGAARTILLEAAEGHPSEPIIYYNLGCYECQLGNLDAAKERLKQAFELNSQYRAIALDDPDLEPLWQTLAAP